MSNWWSFHDNQIWGSIWWPSMAQRLLHGKKRLDCFRDVSQKTRPRSLDRSARWSLVNFPNIYSWTKMKYSWTKIKYSWTEIKYSWTKIKYTWTKIKYSWTKIKYSWTEIKYSWYPLTAAPFDGGTLWRTNGITLRGPRGPKNGVTPEASLGGWLACWRTYPLQGSPLNQSQRVKFKVWLKSIFAI